MRPHPGDEDAVADQSMTRQYVQTRLADLPTQPEHADTRLRGLLEIYEELNADGHPEPLTLLAGVLGIPAETLVLHLRAAGRQ